MELTKGIVIFGATGDLCKRKLIPALFKLWEKGLLPHNFLITGASRRERSPQQWKESLGNYPEEFLHQLDYISADLDNVDTLSHLPNYLHDNTYFLSVPPERYANAIINLKEAGKLDDPEASRVVIEKPFGYDFKSADNLQSVVERHLRLTKFYGVMLRRHILYTQHKKTCTRRSESLSLITSRPASTAAFSLSGRQVVARRSA